MSADRLRAENDELRSRLEEAEETLRAIRDGGVDAVVVHNPAGHRIFTLEGADRPYRLLVEQMPQAAVTLDADGVIIYCNLALANLLWVPHARLPGTPLREFVADDDRLDYDRLLADVPAPTGGEARLRRADGGAVPALFSFNRLPPDCGAAVGVLVTDLTAHKHHEMLTAAHAALRVSEERFRTLFDSMDQGFCVIDVTFDPAGRATDYRFVELNPAFERQSGLAGVLGRSIREAVPGLEEFWYDTYGRVAATGVPTRFVHRAEPLGRWFEVYAFRLSDAGVNRVAVLFTDVSERTRGEQALRDSEERFRSLFETMDEGFCVIEFLDGPHGPLSDYVHVEANPAYLANAGIPDVVGQRVREMVPDEAGGWVEIYRDVLVTGEPVRFERELVATGRHLELAAFRIGPAERRQVAVLFKDVTARTRAEEQLRDADRRKDEFLATLAHELRNPLAPVRNGLHVMKLAAGDPVMVEKARAVIERQVGQMAHLIDDLMDLSRISRGKIVLQQTRLSVAAPVGTAIDTSRPLIDQQGHRLTVDLPAEPVYVDGDNTRLTQVFANLLNNAAKYTEKGGDIRLSVARQGAEVVVRVADTGVGIAPHMLPKVFDMFSQVDRSLERSQGGLGIGLNIVKRLVEMHGGSIAVESGGYGAGSTFTVRLPVASAGPVERADGGADPVPRLSGGGRRRILVVDDNPDGADSLAQMLRLMGNEIRRASDGLEAVDVAGAFRPDVILMDIGMPRLNGYDACRRIREQPWGRTPVIVACTGWGQVEDKKRSRDSGFDLHLVKPVDPVVLDKLLSGLRVPAS